MVTVSYFLFQVTESLYVTLKIFTTHVEHVGDARCEGGYRWSSKIEGEGGYDGHVARVRGTGNSWCWWSPRRRCARSLGWTRRSPRRRSPGKSDRYTILERPIRGASRASRRKSFAGSSIFCATLHRLLFSLLQHVLYIHTYIYTRGSVLFHLHLFPS